MKDSKRPNAQLGARHPRLAMFYKSSVMNMLMVWMCAFLLTVDWEPVRDMYPYSLIPCGLLFAIALCYTLWFWIRKPASIPVCGWLSDVSAAYALYFLIVCGIKSDRFWWNMFALVAAIAVFVIYLVKGNDKPRGKADNAQWSRGF